MATYLMGPMAGLPEGNFPAFRAASADLREQGEDVISPAELNAEDGIENAAADPNHPRRHEFLARDLTIICDPRVHQLVTLPGWEQSQGCAVEFFVAHAIGKPVLAYPTLETVTRPPVAVENVLEEANRLTSGERGKVYGHPAVTEGKVAAAWRAVFGWDVDAYRVSLAMVILKTVRADVRRLHRDNLVDIPGYARTAEAVLAHEGEPGFVDIS